MKQKQVQKKVKAWLLTGRSITHNQCHSMFKGSRLAAVIHRLRKEMVINTEIIRNKNGDQYAKYKLKL